jgi:hypothetical protein
VISRTIVMTGASDGIGAAGAARLNALGNTVVVIGRSKEKTMAVANSLEAEYFVADFSDLDQVRALAANLLERYETIDALVNNAGGIMGPRRITVDGHEATFQINHLAPFLLTTLLLDRLITSRASVITTSSVANRFVGRVTHRFGRTAPQNFSTFSSPKSCTVDSTSGACRQPPFIQVPSRPIFLTSQVPLFTSRTTAFSGGSCSRRPRVPILSNGSRPPSREPRGRRVSTTPNAKSPGPISRRPIRS